ncbi:MAG: hypothetical protein WAM11_10330 [Cyanobium sp.]
MTMLDRLNGRERQQMQRLRDHPLFERLPTLAWDDLLGVLIQRRFLSLSIVNVYEFVIDGLHSDAIRSTVRSILHEEYPRNTRGVPLASHRELLFRDLLHLGASREQILLRQESAITALVRRQSLEQLQAGLHLAYSDLALVSFLRFWAEVLVAVEYDVLWPRLSERLSQGAAGDGVRSEFFYYHMIHDRRQGDIGEVQLLGGLTHAQELARHLVGLIDSEAALHGALEQVDRAWQLKDHFYSQFVQGPD